MSMCAALLTATAVLAGVQAGAAPAPTGPAREGASVRDQVGNVRIFAEVGGLSRAERTSIDIRRVDLEAHATSVRITVWLGRVLTARRFQQIMVLSLTPAEGSAATGTAGISFSPQRRRLAHAAHDVDGAGSYVACDPLRAQVLRRPDRVLLDVPERCIPAGLLTVRVTSSTGFFGSDAARSWSRDRVRFPRPVMLRDEPPRRAREWHRSSRSGWSSARRR
jgi:hypothetical protein